MKRISRLFSRLSRVIQLPETAEPAGLSVELISTPSEAYLRDSTLPVLTLSFPFEEPQYEGFWFPSSAQRDLFEEPPSNYYEYFENKKPQSVFSTERQGVKWTLPLPCDIVFEIIDTYFPRSSRSDTRTLFALAGTARCLTSYCRSLLYRKITINHQTKSKKSMPENIAELLCLCPEVVDFVQTIQIDDTGGMFQHSAPFPEDEQCLRYILLKGYPNIRRMELSLPVMWILLPSKLQAAFETCFQSPTLREFSILRGRIPASLLQCLPFVQDLELRAVVSYPDVNITSPPNACRPKKLVITDFTDEGETLENVFHENCPLSLEKLEKLEIHTSAKLFRLLKPVVSRASSSLVALTVHATALNNPRRPPLSQLNKLKTFQIISDLTITPHSAWTTAAESWIASTLTKLPRPSTLETIEIVTTHGLNYRSIDSTFGHLNFNMVWPRLHSVRLQVATASDQIVEEEIRLAMPTLTESNILHIGFVTMSDYPHGKRVSKLPQPSAGVIFSVHM